MQTSVDLINLSNKEYKRGDTRESVRTVGEGANKQTKKSALASPFLLLDSALPSCLGLTFTLAHK